MNSIRNACLRLSKDKKVSGRIYAVTVAAALIILVFALRGQEQKGTFITDDEGNVTGIRRSSMEETEEYDLMLSLRDAGELVSRDITVTLRAVSGAQDQADEEDADIQEHNASLEREIESMLTDIEYSDDETVALPSALGDGTKIFWQAAKQKDRSGLVFIPLIYLTLVAAIIGSSLTEGKDKEKEDRRVILRALPRFCNQLFLMMNAGMIFSDALGKICASYLEADETELTSFERDLISIYGSGKDGRMSAASVISEYAARHNVKELVRIAAILTENEKRGSDVLESLERESRFLWDERKIAARESGKMIDTKMSLPHALLLVMLIMITMAPAMLSF